MEAQRKHMFEPFTLEATAALLDLVRISRCHGAAVEMRRRQLLSGSLSGSRPSEEHRVVFSTSPGILLRQSKRTPTWGTGRHNQKRKLRSFRRPIGHSAHHASLQST